MSNDKNSNYEKAVARATGKGEVSTAPAIPVSHDLVKKADDATIAAMLADPSLEFAVQNHNMEQGEMLEGILEGNGPDAEFERHDPHTNTVTTNVVQTWIVSSFDGTKRVSILSSVQLDKKLPPFVGGPVKIVRGKDINIGDAKRMTDYLVAGPKLKNGQRRSWATQRPQVIDASASAPALPPGTGNSEAAAH